MSNPLPKADVVIIGLGAAGGIAANVLTQAGIDVVGLEAGPYLSNEDFLANEDEIAGRVRNWTGAPKYNHETPTWRPDAASPTAPLPFPAIQMANMVGGTSVHYATQQWRFREDDFTSRTDTIERYGAEAIPEGSTMVDWPITYDDLEPYYDQVEYLIGVSGEAGANPFESPRRRGYPMPPLRRFGYGEMAAEAMSALGYNPFPQPTAVTSEEYNGRPACTYCGYCENFGCWNDSKSSTLVTAIRSAEETGHLEIRPNSRVLRINSNDRGEVTDVEYLDEQGQLQVQPAGMVILSTYVYENVRLMFLSASDAHPEGIGNASGQLGKHFMSHVYVANRGLFPGKRLGVYAGTYGQAISMDDLNGDNFDHTGLGFLRGAVIFASNAKLPINQSRSLAPGTPAWGSGYKAWIHEHADSIGQLVAQVEPLPYKSTFLDLDPRATDPLGMPKIRVTYSLHDNEIRAQQYISDRLDEILVEMGATATWPEYPPGAPIPVTSHAYGGTRMGDDEATSVVNRYGMVHDAKNLFVLGASSYPGTSGYNPTHTLQAHAWYAAEHIAENLNDIAI